MNFFKKQWEAFKQKSIWGKLSDLLFVALLAMLINSDGRIFLQRIVLETGIFGSFYENVDEEITPANWDFTFVDLEGNPHQLREFRGRPIFLNFWATWCPPCNAEIPSMIDLMASCEDQDLAFLLVTREPVPKVRAFLAKKNWDIPVYIGQLLPAMELNYSSLPTTFIINEDGRLVHESTGAKKWNDEEILQYFSCE